MKWQVNLSKVKVRSHKSIRLTRVNLRKIKDVKELGPKNVTNALFVGSTTELQKMIKKNKDKK